MHKTLERQLIRLYGSVEDIPAGCQDLLSVVSKTYTDFEAEYSLIERSLDISSKELTDSNERLQAEIKTENERSSHLEKINNMMVDRELKMVELKKEISELKSKLLKSKVKKQMNITQNTCLLNK